MKDDYQGWDKLPDGSVIEGFYGFDGYPGW